MLDDVNVGGAGGGAGAGDSGGGGATVVDASGSESEVLERAALDSPATEPASKEPTAAAPDKGAEAAAKEAPAAEDVNLAALEEGQPEWLAKVTDPAARAEVEKLLAHKDALQDWFKDDAERDAFLKELPGGREQIAAMQTLSKEVGELDSAIEANTPEGNLGVAERYLSMAPDGGVGLLRAAAQHMAKASPESWNQISSELVNSTLSAAGIGTDLNGVLGAISEMRAAVAADDGEAFGRAAGKLLGAPKAAEKQDPALVRATEREQAARTEARNAKLQVWESNVTKAVETAQQHIRQSIGTALAAKDGQGRPLIPASIPQKAREDLSERIFKEIDQQLGADSWLTSQIFNLVGSRTGDKQNLAALKEHFDKASELSRTAATRLLAAAVRKHVSAWSKELAASSKEAIERAKGNGVARKDVGGGTPQSKGPKTLSETDIVGKEAKSDKEILEMTLGL
jgi:hypothetical protein